MRAQKPHLVVKCDAVIVGSGAGGGVTAAVLTAAGLRVVVLEKAGFVTAKDMTLQVGHWREWCGVMSCGGCVVGWVRRVR